MNRFSSFIVGIGVGIVGLYMSMHFTLVRATDGFHMIPKIAAKLDIPFADIRSFTLANWQRKQPLALAILKAKKGYLLQDRSLVAFKQSSQHILDQFALVANSKTGQ